MKAQKEESAQRCLRLVMSKYIDRVALFNSLSDAKTVEEVFAAIQAAPTADVVEVVRCKDCKHKYGYKCDYDDRPVGRGDYCSRGERIDEVTE